MARWEAYELDNVQLDIAGPGGGEDENVAPTGPGAYQIVQSGGKRVTYKKYPLVLVCITESVDLATVGHINYNYNTSEFKP